MIEREAKRLERLIRDLLDLARLRRRTFSSSPEPLDLGEIALEAISRYEPQSRAYGVDLVVSIEAEAGAMADPDRTLQALSNLVENALRCTPRGGSVRIVATPGRLDVDRRWYRASRPAISRRAFERFYLWDRYGADRPVGTGLGLAIVAELAVRHGRLASPSQASRAPGRRSRSCCARAAPPELPAVIHLRSVLRGPEVQGNTTGLRVKGVLRSSTRRPQT